MKLSPPFEFTARVARVARAGYYAVAVPAWVSKAIGKRGNVPIVAVVDGVAEVRASLVPSGGGRHRLRLNAEARAEVGAKEGSRVAIVLRLDEEPMADPLPPDLVRALRDAGALAAFQGFPAGKQRHILKWIEKSAREATREKRVAMTVEVAQRARERAEDRDAGRRPAPR